MTKLNGNEWWFGPLFRIAGYALLALSLFDIIDIFVPSRFTDPVWEFQTLRNLVERAPVPLLGLVLIFSGEKNSRILKFLSWSCLVVGMLFILLLPLGVSASFRIYQQNNLQLTSQLSKQTAEIKQVQDTLNQATTAEDINSILARLNPQGRLPETNNPQLLKKQLLSEVAKAQKIAKDQTEANQTKARLLLVKNALKSLLGALVCGIVFFTIWDQTRKVLKVNRR